MNRINKELFDKAIALGLCTQGQANWQESKNPQELIDMFKSGLEFCFKHHFPTNKYIKRNFKKELLQENNVYVDDEFYTENPKSDCVILGKCDGKLLFNGFAVRDVYINDDSDVEIQASGLSKIFVNVYGNTKVHLVQKESSKIFVYRYGDDSVISYSGNVIIKDRTAQ